MSMMGRTYFNLIMIRLEGQWIHILLKKEQKLNIINF